mmetsp:Transcript_18471/g.44501  ORF Transcript_18471/g.44501 Transcript_18471/m.44501 type:complete len:207 (-) Transcript_18471:76-696(-)
MLFAPCTPARAGSGVSRRISGVTFSGKAVALPSADRRRVHACMSRIEYLMLSSAGSNPLQSTAMTPSMSAHTVGSSKASFGISSARSEQVDPAAASITRRGEERVEAARSSLWWSTTAATVVLAPSVPATSTATLLWSVRATPIPGQRPSASGVSSPQWRRLVGAASAPHGRPECANKSAASCRSLKSCRGNDAAGRYRCPGVSSQ